MVLTDDQKRQFIRDGFVVLPQIVPQEKVDEILEITDGAYHSGDCHVNESKPDDPPDFPDEVSKHRTLSQLLRQTPILAACDDLIGENKSHYGHKAQVAYRPKDHVAIKRGMKITDPMPSYKYHIDGGDGKYKETASAFTILVGVCLSSGQDVEEARGQFNVWPGMFFPSPPLPFRLQEQPIIHSFD